MKKWDSVNESGFILYPIGSNVFFKREKIKGVVTAHGYSVNGGGKLIGIKVDGLIGSALLYNREAMLCELDLI